jgi:hypothetical protein
MKRVVAKKSAYKTQKACAKTHAILVLSGLFRAAPSLPGGAPRV